MKYMMLFWVDESAETTANEDAAIMVAVKSWVDQMTEAGSWCDPTGTHPGTTDRFVCSSG